MNKRVLRLAIPYYISNFTGPLVGKVENSQMGNHALLLSQLTFIGIRGIMLTIYYKTAILERFLKA
jgi:hypothetical protein